MSFEVETKDILGRVGRIYTRSGVLETPNIFPVIDIKKQELKLDVVKKYFNNIITNSYFIYNIYKSVVSIKNLLGWDGILMTDSGAYQLMRYGTIDVDPDDILKYQAEIGSDIGVMLDLPMDSEESYFGALIKVEETLRRAQRAAELREELGGMLLVGPIQGGVYKDLVARSARRMTSLPFDIYAIGSPTTLLEEYRFDEILDIVLTAKLNMRREAPLHLFGAGHPLILPFAVAAGIDLFDSASYILYARDDRIMLRDRTIRLEDVKTDYLPCSTKLCNKQVSELKEMDKMERTQLIAEHNLAVLREEILEVRQRIYEGTLWEYLEEKARAHRSLYSSLHLLRKFTKLVEEYDPVTHPEASGLLFFSDTALGRPEPYRHRARMRYNYDAPPKQIAIFLKATSKPYNRSWEYIFLNKILICREKIHIFFIDEIFGVVPEEIAEVYPLSQHESWGLLENIYNDILEISRKYQYVIIYGLNIKSKNIINVNKLEEIPRYIRSICSNGTLLS
ncbi:tRNA guanosine(15) transglycosylase TgtA [Thermoproteus tenax]|uniref:tRNA-guanine(15) transglycosylase n=1 Tax=Thermoproteus tenax (strain ATCC 35583 / DSM 2078 / JCM 9277 / NBRC 100435 / Kra 1) TaxID=768679 RepID=G4RLV3_THETK|nr:tRNA guanosine(15) transglycosylase TgtA [Thermoproteus tenax]CCC82548.1 queuine tRNA-ribosyltransferase [Thermoproteus tenax Kra 1]